MSTPVDGTPATEGKGRRRWAVVPLLLIVLLLGFALFGERGILRALQYRRQKEALELRLHEVELANEGLRREIEALRSDRRRIEALARKELGMVRDDELVYQYPPHFGSAAKATTPLPKFGDKTAE